MNGELAQAIALVAYGHASLTQRDGLRDAIASFEETNSTFQYVRQVSFDVHAARRQPAEAGSVAEWLRHVSQTGIDHLWLLAGSSGPPAFANQGLWGIVGTGRKGVEAWYGQWNVNREQVDPSETKPRIWEVTYRSSYRKGTMAVDSGDIAARIRELHEAIEGALAFTQQFNVLDNFAPWFREAFDLETAEQPQIHWHPDLLPSSGYSLDARRLIAMAARSWVFGGMGSWNDIVPNDSEMSQYKETTDRLYQAVVGGLRDGTNAFAF
jgi:hypothetical protein